MRHTRPTDGMARALRPVPLPGRVARGLLLGALLLLLGAAGGCLDEAEDTSYAFGSEAGNPNDPDPADTGDTSDDQGNIAIAGVTTLNEVVTIVNGGTVAVTMTGWTLVNEGSNLAEDSFTFPAFTLGAGAYVRVHSDTGSNDADDLYWDGGAGHWAAGDTAVLSNAEGTPIATCSEGDSCWDGGG